MAVMALGASCAPEDGQAQGWEEQVAGLSAAPEAVLVNVTLGKEQWQAMGVNILCVKALTGDGFRQKDFSFINPYFSFLNKYKWHCHSPSKVNHNKVSPGRRKHYCEVCVFMNIEGVTVSLGKPLPVNVNFM